MHVTKEHQAAGRRIVAVYTNRLQCRYLTAGSSVPALHGLHQLLQGRSAPLAVTMAAGGAYALGIHANSAAGQHANCDLT